MEKVHDEQLEDGSSSSSGDSSSDSSDSSSSDSSSSSNSDSDSDSGSDSHSDSFNKKPSTPASSHSDEASSEEENYNTKKDSSHCSSSSNNDAANAKQYWLQDPDMYGVRRSSREKKQPEHIASVTQVKEAKSRRKRSDQWHSSDESHSDSSDSEGYSCQPKVRKKAPLRRRKKSYSSDEDNNRMRTSRTGGKVSYKEDSETDAQSDYEETQELVSYEAPEDDQNCQTIDKVLRHRIGKKGAVGQQTYIYEVEKIGDPNTDFDENDAEQVEAQYLIKWKNWSHLHNTWESLESLNTQKVKGIKKLENFVQREDAFKIWNLRCSPEEVEYASIQNEMEFQFISSHINAERIFAEAEENDIKFYYVKWQNLPYREATWENETMVNERFSLQLAAFQAREESPYYPKPVAALKYRPKFRALKVQPDYIGANDTFALRDYQLDGLNWLIHAWSSNNSVILADEMGLGKTIQAVSFLSYLFHTHDIYGPYLIVLPLSTINAWLKEFEQWAPNMNVIVYMGDRKSRNIIHEYEWVSQGSRRIKFNAVLTTYEILLRDKDLLQDSCQWSCLVVDEAHRLKNVESQLYQALQSFKTNYRLLITGTPLQNHMGELWALLHFIMPERFDNCEYFEQCISGKSHMKKDISRLHKMLEPYILRRVKKEVEKSLPAKVEQILRVDMTQAQRNYYRDILTKNYDKLRKGTMGSCSSFINIAMELKKCCNHATLIREEEEAATVQKRDILQKLLRGSGKLLLLDKLLVRLHETGHRVLIFSQMVMMLDILAYYMQLRRFPFQRLDGSISGELRRQALDHFNAEASSDFCFLLSTRAGGLGINLATADTVIIFDSDWNPQNDLQAQARAHRIGQKKQVNIYRLVTKNSIEETIIERAKQKMVLDHIVIQSMDTSGRTVFNKKLSSGKNATPFDKKELNAILKFGAEDLFGNKSDDENEEEPVCDIDEILQRAETRDEGPSSASDDLLSAFKVASFNFEEEPPKIEPDTDKSWDAIIPEAVRNQAMEEEKQKEMAKLYLPPRKRNTANSTEKGPRVNRNRRGSDYSDGDSDHGMPRRRGRPRMHHKETVNGFADVEVRRFIKSFKKFSNPMRRLDTIASDAQLRDKNHDDLTCLGQMIIERCKETIRDHTVQKASERYPPTANGGTKQRRDRGPSFKLSGVPINARTMMAALDELEPLDYVVPHPPVERASWVVHLKKVKDAHWDIPWGINEDSRLLRGIYEFGMGSWDQIKLDATLNLGDKILLPDEQKPQAKHLENRAQYLLKLIKKTAPVTISKLKPKQGRPKGVSVKEIKPISKEIIDDDDSTDDEATNHSTLSTAKSSPKTSTASQRLREDDNHRMEVDSSKVKVKRESEHSDRKSDHRSRPKKSKEKEKKIKKEPSIPPITNGTPSPVDVEMELNLSHPLWPKCKDMMRPMKKVLKLLDNPDGPEDEIKVDKKCLIEIGDHTENILKPYIGTDTHSQWKLLLWQFVAKFTSYEAKALHKVYKTYKKEKESRREASHKDKEERPKSVHRERKKDKRKAEESLQSASKRPRNGTQPNEKEKNSHSEDKNKNRRRDYERSNEGEYNRNYDRHSSGSRDHPKESRYPQDFKRDGHSSGGGYHRENRESSYPYNAGESGYSQQGYSNYKGDWGGQRSHHQSYSSQSNYPSSHYPHRGGGGGGGGGYNQPPHAGRQSYSQRSNYNHGGQYGSSSQKPVGWSHNRDDRGPPPFQT